MLPRCGAAPPSIFTFDDRTPMRYRPKTYLSDVEPVPWEERVAPVRWDEPEPDGICRSGKVRYGSREDARMCGLHARQRRKYRGTEDPDRFECGLYQCSMCRGWHVTSNPRITDTVEFF